MSIVKVLDFFRYELALEDTSGEDFATSIGMSYSSYKNVIRDGSLVVPKWVLAYLLGKGYYFEGNCLLEKKSDASHQVCVCNADDELVSDFSSNAYDSAKYDYKYDNE